MRSCPICQRKMSQETRSNVTIDVCKAHGIWLDKQELLLITERDRHERGPFVWKDLFRSEQIPESTPDRVLQCPIGGEKMRKEVYEHVEIDWCNHHGVWLDNGELDAILNNLRLDPGYLRGMRLRLWEAQL